MFNVTYKSMVKYLDTKYSILIYYCEKTSFPFTTKTYKGILIKNDIEMYFFQVLNLIR